MLNELPVIPGFTISSILGTGSTSVVYLATRNQKNYALKLLTIQNDSNSLDYFRRFSKEAATIAKLNHSGLVKLHEFSEVNGRPYLVMELAEGETLRDKISQGALSEAEIIKIALTVARTMDYFHCRGVIHKDLKPENILIDAQGETKIIDFGFASEQNEAHQETDQKDLVGTLQYAAPEQMESLERTVDSRSDLYALGGTLYHCATGAPAFGAKSATELLQQHRLEVPTAPSGINQKISPVLSAVILKLLEKDPDRRYQSAKGLALDLENLGEIARGQKPFALGLNDTGLRVSELPLFGRSEEFKTILKTFDQARDGKGSVLLIEGEGGSGKTRIVRELLSSKKSEGYFILGGKAKQGEAIPFGPLREALDNLLSHAQRKSETDQAKIYDGLRAAAGDFAAIVRRLSPALQNIFKDVQDIAPLDGNAEQERFYLKIAEFFLALPNFFGPTIFLIDDVQWLDEGSLEIFHRLTTQLKANPFLFITTSRNDPASKASLNKFIKSITGAELVQIALSPLKIDAVEQLVAAHLGGKILESSIVERIATKANGNPFAIGEYLRALLDRGMLKPTEESWVFDKEHFEELELSDDVIQLLINRIEALTPVTKKALSLAAVIGFEFETELLILTNEGQRETVHRALAEGLQKALIEKNDRGYNFVHDRVSEALIQTLTPEHTKAIHQKIAESMDLKPLSSPQFIYALARHYYLGFREQNVKKVYLTNLAAGIHALENFSNEEALELLGRALSIAKIINIYSSELSRIYEFIGLASTRTGRQQDAIRNFNLAIALVDTAFDRAKLHYFLGLSHASEGLHDLAKNELFKALELLSNPFAKTIVGSVFSLIGHFLAAHFQIYTRLGFGKAKGADRLRRQLVSKINSTMNLLAYFLGDQLMMAQSVIRELHNVQYLGVCVETAKAHTFYGILTSFGATQRYTIKHCKIAIDMAKQLGDQEAIAYCEFYFAVSIEFAGDVIWGHQLLLDVYPKVIKYCSAWEKSSAIGHRTHILIEGKAAEAIEWLEETLPEMHSTGDIAMLSSVYSSLYSSYHMLGNVVDATRILKLQQALPEQIGATRFTNTYFFTNFIHGCLMQDDFSAELESKIQELSQMGLDMYHSRHRFSLIGYIRLEQFYRERNQLEKKKKLKILKAAVQKAGFPNALTPIHLAHSMALRGAWQSACGRIRKAQKSLLKAERFANMSDNLWAHFVIARERARIARTQGQSSVQEFEALKALKLATAEGWLPLAKQIEREFNIKIHAAETDLKVLQTDKVNYGRLLTGKRHAEALLQISIASASTLNLQQQSQAILDELVKVLGAERAFFFEDDPAEPGSLKMRGGRDSFKNDIVALKGYSSTVVNKVGREHKPLLVSGTEEGEVLGAQSVAVHNLRSILAVPVLFREKFMGVIYLDSTIAKGIFSESDVEIVSAIANHIAVAIESARSANFEIENYSMKKDLEVAQAVQSLILPDENTLQMPQIQMSSFYKAASQSGGDWWSYDLDPQQSTFSVLMGDVTGHGAGSAMISAAVAGIHHAFNLMKKSDQHLPDFLLLLDKTLFKLAKNRYLMSVLGFEINLLNGQMEIWSAGAPPLFILKPDETYKQIYAGGNLLGLGGDKFQYGHKTQVLEPGSRIAIFTDGIFEIETAGNTQLGLSRLAKVLAKTRKEDVDKASTATIKNINELCITSVQEDDITLVLIDYLGPKQAV